MEILVYGIFIRVWREKEVIQGSCMKQLFLRNGSHEGMCAYSNSIRKCKLKISQHPSQYYCQLPQNSSRKPVGRFDKRNSHYFIQPPSLWFMLSMIFSILPGYKGADTSHCRSLRHPGRASRIIPNAKAARYSGVHRFRGY